MKQFQPPPAINSVNGPKMTRDGYESIIISQAAVRLVCIDRYYCRFWGLGFRGMTG